MNPAPNKEFDHRSTYHLSATSLLDPIAHAKKNGSYSRTWAANKIIELGAEQLTLASFML